jgi:hypothetical protein
MYVSCSTLGSNVLASNHWYAGMHVAATAVNAVAIHIVCHSPKPNVKVRYACELIMGVIGVRLLVVAITVSTYGHTIASTGQHRPRRASVACRSWRSMHAPIALVWYPSSKAYYVFAFLRQSVIVVPLLLALLHVAPDPLQHSYTLRRPSC